ncbi:MAG: glucokinase [Desulfomonilia bacterium]|nr:glucokinase [Desulfomonilia bacterium]
MRVLIAGDIGGTKTNLGLFSLEGGPRSPLEEATYRSADYASLEKICAEFIAATGAKVSFGAFGVAGPVSGTRASITNLPWIIESDTVRSALSLTKAVVMNDLESIAYGIALLDDKDLHVLSSGDVHPGGPRAIIAPGTGLGEAYLTWNGSRYRAHPSEGGHADFAPTNVHELALLRHLMGRFDHVSVERVCSGSGIPNIYTFLKEEHLCDEPARYAEQLANAPDKTAHILSTALDEQQAPEICTRTLEMFLSILGAETGNLALKILATGGIYLGGGILPRILPAVNKSSFLDSFLNKGRLSPILKHIPISVILNPNVALMGTALVGLEMMETM